MQKKCSLVLTLTLVPLGISLFLLREPFLLTIGDLLIVQDNLEPADVIHIIAGDDYRTDYAIQLYKQGFGKVIFFTGGWCTFHHYYHGRHGMERALAKGVPRQAIAIDETHVTSTYSETLRLKRYIAQNQRPVRSVIVVSDPHHMRRAQWTYRQVLGDGIKVQMAPVPFGISQYQRRWWQDENSRLMVKEEYLKLLYYYARYGLGWAPMSKWLASFDVE